MSSYTPAVITRVYGPKIITVNYSVITVLQPYQKCDVDVEQQNYALGGRAKSGERLHVYKQYMHIIQKEKLYFHKVETSIGR